MQLQVRDSCRCEIADPGFLGNVQTRVAEGLMVRGEAAPTVIANLCLRLDAHNFHITPFQLRSDWQNAALISIRALTLEPGAARSYKQS